MAAFLLRAQARAVHRKARPAAPARSARKLDVFELFILDDVGYVQQTRDEIKVLFTPHGRALRAPVTAHHLEPRLLGVGSHFQDANATQAEIDRLVHHSVILNSMYRASAPTPSVDGRAAVTTNEEEVEVNPEYDRLGASRFLPRDRRGWLCFALETAEVIVVVRQI